MGDFQPFVLSAEMLGHEGPVSQVGHYSRRHRAQRVATRNTDRRFTYNLLSCPSPCSLDVLPSAIELPPQSALVLYSSHRLEACFGTRRKALAGYGVVRCHSQKGVCIGSGLAACAD